MKIDYIQYSILVLLTFIASSISMAGDPIQIGTSNVSRATAGNSGRKIARTSDDKLFVVYQDEINGQPVIQYTYSEDRVHWTEPEILANGWAPSLAIGKNNRIFIAWTSNDYKKLEYTYFENGQFANTIVEINNSKYKNIRKSSLEATGNFLHIVWSDNRSTQYRRSNFELDDIVVENLTIEDGSSPIIVADLEYKDGPIYIFNNIFKFDFLETEDIQDVLINRPPTETEFVFYMDTELSRFSASARGNYVVFACNTTNGAAIGYIGSHFPTITPIEGVRPRNPSVDDTIPYNRSCAIVWEDLGDIYYGQSEDGNIIKKSVVQLSDSYQLSHYPSVCYKTYRYDLFDVIWTEGDAPPYKVMFKRHAKDYSYFHVDNFVFNSAILDTGIYKHQYQDEIHTSPRLNKMVFDILENNLPNGLDHERNPGHTPLSGNSLDIHGYPLKSGTFTITVKAYVYYNIDIYTKTATFTITIINNKPQITSPAFVSLNNGQIMYQAAAIDPEDNEIEFVFEDYPTWLTPDSTFISGSPSLGTQDTTFTLIATDGEMADTLQVSILLHSNVVTNRDKQIPKVFALLPNYPNPFNPSTRIRYAVPRTSDVTLSIYDINGQQTAQLQRGQQQAGYHEIEWKTSHLPSGTYLIRMEAGEFKQVRKCLLLK